MRPADSFADTSDSAANGSARGARDAGSLCPATSEAFALALRAAIATGVTESESLRNALRTFVDEMRDHHEPPERALIAVKERVAIALHRRSDLEREQAASVLRQIVHWTIEAYFRAD